MCRAAERAIFSTHATCALRYAGKLKPVALALGVELRNTHEMWNDVIVENYGCVIELEAIRSVCCDERVSEEEMSD